MSIDHQIPLISTFPSFWCADRNGNWNSLMLEPKALAELALSHSDRYLAAKISGWYFIVSCPSVAVKLVGFVDNAICTRPGTHPGEVILPRLFQTFLNIVSIRFRWKLNSFVYFTIYVLEHIWLQCQIFWPVRKLKWRQAWVQILFGMITWDSKHPCLWNWSTQRQDFSWLLKTPLKLGTSDSLTSMI